MSNVQRGYWRERWLKCIDELTSITLQNRTWLNPHNENPHWSFLEFMSCYFDDLDIDMNYERLLADEWITCDEFSVIKDWHHALERYTTPTDDIYNHESILADANWIAIVKIGFKAKYELSSILDQSERHLLKI